MTSALPVYCSNLAAGGVELDDDIIAALDAASSGSSATFND
jgi:hypothetical protein